MRIKFIIIYQN